MPRGEYLGEFEQLVLIALIRLDKEAYGVRVQREISERTGRDVTFGAVYATLDRLVAKGHVESWLADPTPVRGGRSKRYFRMTAAGVEALRESQQALTNMWTGVPNEWSAS